MNADLSFKIKVGFLAVVWSAVAAYLVWYFIVQGRHNMREARERKKRHKINPTKVDKNEKSISI